MSRFLQVKHPGITPPLTCDINIGEDFETTVHELRSYFGFFRLQRTCETILRFYSYDGATNYIKCRTGGIQGDRPEFMVFCFVTIHLWGRIFTIHCDKFPDTKGLAYADDGNIIASLSKALLKLIVVLKSVFKKDENLDSELISGRLRSSSRDPRFNTYSIARNISSTMIPTFTEIANDFTLDMFKDEGI